MPIAITGNPPNITAAGEYTTIASGIFGDDFALGEDGAAYIAANLMNEVFKVTQKGKVSGSWRFEWYDHSRRCKCSFGEDRDKNVLYVVTNGAIARRLMEPIRMAVRLLL